MTAADRATALLLAPQWPLMARMCPVDDSLTSFVGLVSGRCGTDVAVGISLGAPSASGSHGGGGLAGPKQRRGVWDPEEAPPTLRFGTVHMAASIAESMDVISRRHVQAVGVHGGGGVVLKTAIRTIGSRTAVPGSLN